MVIHTWKVLILFVIIYTTNGQSNGVPPDISEILRGNSVLESAVMDLSSAVAADFVNKAPLAPGILPPRTGHNTDIHGNQASSHSSGIHVDLPGEHGNTNDFPVVHRENVPHAAHELHQAALEANILETQTHVGPSQPHPNEMFHGENVFHGTGSNGPASSKQFVDLAAENTLSQSAAAHQSPVLTGHSAVGIPALGEVVANKPAIAPSDGFISKGAGDGFLPDSNMLGVDVGVAGPETVHVDPPGVHGNIIDLHREPVPGLADVHVDLPGEHGNMGNTPVVHRNTGPLIHTPAVGPPFPDPGHVGPTAHVDLPGEHGNTGNTPIVHREIGPVVPPMTGPTMTGPMLPPLSGGPIPAGVPFPNEPILNGGVHVDRPGEHGNFGDTPVVHRDGAPAFPPGNFGPAFPPMTGPSLPPLPTGPVPFPGGEVHVDQPGEHGNFGDAPVVHREVGTIPTGAELIPPFNPAVPIGGSVHVDRPGEHGNMGPTPVVHREPVIQFGPGGMPPINTAFPVGPANVHVDMPGEHGNFGDRPVVHRDHGIGVGVPNPLVPGVVPGAPHGGIHGSPILPGSPVSGPIVPEPIVPGPGVSGPVITGPVVPNVPHGPNHLDIHIDAPGEHGNPHNEPSLHLPPGATVEDARAAGVIPPLAGKPLGVPEVGVAGLGVPGLGVPGLGVPGLGVPGLGKPIPALHPNHLDIHIDAPGEHGNPHNEPSLHLPPGATVEDARAAGVIPPLAGKPLGVPDVGLPGLGVPGLGVPGLGKSIPALHPKHGDIHIDAPGEHGNPHNEPALHLPPGATLDDAIAAGVIPHKNVGPAIPPKLPPKYPHKHETIHIDGPGEHGNPLLEPSLHLPPGATIDDARAAGVIPPYPINDAIPLGPIMPTGVLPGTLNVPIKPKRTGRKLTGGKRGRKQRKQARKKGKKNKMGHPHDHHDHNTPTKKPKSGVTVIRVSRPNPLNALANAVRGMLGGTGGGGGGLLGSLFRSAAATQVRPNRGITIVGGGPPPNVLINSMFGNMIRG